VVGCVVFFVLVFVLALWWLFPYRELASRIETLLQPTGLSAQIQGLGPGPFPGFRARQVRIEPLDESWGPIDLSKARVRLLPIAALRGGGFVELAAEVMGGSVEARYRHGARASVWALWEQIDLGQVALPPVMANFPIAGAWSGNLEAQLEWGKPEQVTGQLETSFSEVKVGAGKIKGVPIPEVSLGEGAIRASAADAAKLEVGTAEFKDGELGIDFNGSILFRKRLSRSLVNGALSLSPNDRVSKELALLFALFPGPRASDGRYTARVRGDFNRMRLLKR
jgi:type II secretion system protein N